jgi:geranylgeranylglycerol-phosphate geranylgeranyltransferase
MLAVIIAEVNIIALLTYTQFFKGRPGVGNGVVAYLGGSTFLFGGAVVGHVGATVVLFFLAMLSTFAREVIKDIEALSSSATSVSGLP